MNSIDADITAAGTSGQNMQVGNTHYSDKVDNTDMVSAIVGRMKAYASQWSSSNTQALNDSLHQKAALEAAQLDRYGVHAQYDSSTGSWTITRDDNKPSNVGKKLYNVYHEGTAGVGGVSTLKQDEVFAKLQKGEMVLTQKMVDNLCKDIDHITTMTEAFTNIPDYLSKSAISEILKFNGAGTVNNVTNANRSQAVNVQLGDVNIYGGSAETVRKHQEISRQQANEVLKHLNLHKQDLF